MFFVVFHKLVLKGFMEMHAARYVDIVLTTRVVIISMGPVSEDVYPDTPAIRVIYVRSTLVLNDLKDLSRITMIE